MTIRSNTNHAFAIVFGFSFIQMTIFFHLTTLSLTQTELLLDLVSLETRSWFWQQYPYLQHKGEQRAKILSTKGETAASWKEPVELDPWRKLAEPQHSVAAAVRQVCSLSSRV